MTQKEFEEIKQDIKKNTNTELIFTNKYKLEDLLGNFDLWKYSFDNKPEFKHYNNFLNLNNLFNIYCFVQLLRKHYFIDGNKRFAFEFLFNKIIKNCGQWLHTVKSFDQNILAYIKILEDKNAKDSDLYVFNMICQNFQDNSLDEKADKLEEWKNNILKKLAKEEQ